MYKTDRFGVKDCAGRSIVVNGYRDNDSENEYDY